MYSVLGDPSSLVVCDHELTVLLAFQFLLVWQAQMMSSLVWRKVVTCLNLHGSCAAMEWTLRAQRSGDPRPSSSQKHARVCNPPGKLLTINQALDTCISLRSMLNAVPSTHRSKGQQHCLITKRAEERRCSRDRSRANQQSLQQWQAQQRDAPGGHRGMLTVPHNTSSVDGETGVTKVRAVVVMLLVRMWNLLQRMAQSHAQDVRPALEQFLDWGSML